MAKNEVYKYAEWLNLPVASGVLSGAPVMVGSIPGVAQTDRDADGFASVATVGAFSLVVTGAIAAVGTPVYITSAGALTATATGNTLFGYALATKPSSPDSAIPVKISQV